MRQSLALAFCSLACAQTAFAQGDARNLLQQISDAAHAMNSFRVEGQKTVSVHEGATNRTFEATFSTALKRPHFYRNEQTTSASQVTTLCDGATYWLYFGKVQTYSKKTPEGDTACTLAILSWEQLLDGLTSATFTERDQVPFEGRLQDCEVVRAEYSKFPPAAAIPETIGGTRTLCIDRARNLILRDKLEGVHTTSTTTLTKAEVNPNLPDSLFAFTPPQGSRPASEPAPGQAVPGTSATPQQTTGVYRVGGGVTSPRITYKVEPEFSEQARQAKFDGNVLLSLVVQTDGTSSDIRIVRPLGLGLDEKAIEAVQNWRFAPGEKGGVPVPVQATIEVNFRLLKDDSDLRPGVFRIGPGISAPQVIYKTEPEYTESARQAKLAGTVLVTGVVLADGIPTDLHVARSLDPGLDRSAIDCVSKWRFQPGVKNGVPVPTQVTIEINFKLL